MQQDLQVLSQQAGESADDFAARQQAAREFTTRRQSLAGLAPEVAPQDVLQTQAQVLAQQAAGIDPTTGQKTGLASFEPFLQSSTDSNGISIWFRDTGPWTIRWNRNRSDKCYD